MLEFRMVNRVGVELQFREWDAPNGRATVCLVHGIGEHSGRYQAVAEYFNRRGFSVFAFDHQGHGLSAGKRGDSAGLESMLDDIDLFLDQSRKRSSFKSIFLYGHSMGGNLVLNHVLRRQSKVTGVIATGPWIRLVKPPSKILLALGRLVRPLCPSLTQSNRIDLSELSHDQHVLDQLRQDPLAHDRVSIRMGLELNDAAKFLDQFRGPANCPILLMHGGDDTVTCPNGTKHFAGRVNGDVTMRLWDGLKHEIHNEPEKDVVLGFAADWMNLHVC